MMYVSVRRLFRESFYFIFKNLDILLLYVLIFPLQVMVEVGEKESTLIPEITTWRISTFLRDLVTPVSKPTFLMLLAVMSICLTILQLIITAIVLNRLADRRKGFLAAARHTFNQLFVKGAWWYLLLNMLFAYLLMMRAQLTEATLNSQGLLLVLAAVVFIFNFFTIFVGAIIVDDYHSLKNTLITSWSYAAKSLTTIIEIGLTALGIALMAILPLGILMLAGGDSTFSTSLMRITSVALLLLGPLVKAFYSVVFIKLYTQVKTHNQ